ncbi:hypothetical protein COL516b_011808 [Colletotrichum fioriniae]|nr:uncharacterized protein COL516b_011808 [Colletotrichum fioriniae]KAJ0296278.1 hypothetical protein COL516b_011808 [Colletotrichum fioriniae]
MFGAAMRWRTANDSFERFGGLSWGYYKNAYTIVPELLLQGTNVLACEALLAIATFSLQTADARTTAQLASAAARTAQIIGLHKRETYANLDAVESARRKRVFWATHILNTDMMAKVLLGYPIMASLILLWSALEEPAGSEAHLNVRVIGQFIQFLAGLKEEGCDLNNVLDGCSKMYKIAKYVVHTQRAMRVTAPLEEDNDVKEQLEAREIFADVLGMEQAHPDYGPFAPELLMPHKHNVFFSS